MSVTIADDIVRATHLTDAEFVSEVAVHLYQQQRLTLGQASRLAQMPQARFQHLLASRDAAQSTAAIPSGSCRRPLLNPRGKPHRSTWLRPQQYRASSEVPCIGP